MSLERRRIILTVLVVLGLWSVLGFVRDRRRRKRAEQLARRLDLPAERDHSFVELASLEEARTMDHTAVIMQGGGGTQIYLTVPVKYVACEQATLAVLLKLLDAMEWNDPPHSALSFELAPIGSGVSAGMGGGAIVDGVWIHPRLEALGVEEAVSAVIAGTRPIADVSGTLKLKSG